MTGSGAGGGAAAGGGTVIGDGTLLGSSKDGDSCARVRPPPSSSQGFSSSLGEADDSAPGLGFESFLSITAELG